MTTTTNGIGSATNITEHAQKLLDFNQKLDINLLDSIVGCMYSQDGQDEQRVAQVSKF